MMNLCRITNVEVLVSIDTAHVCLFGCPYFVSKTILWFWTYWINTIAHSLV